jgi:Ser/Thr protein kinase RdoA (MazF antagonist)
MENQSKIQLDRINYSGDIGQVIKRLSNAYDIGDVIDFSIIEIGFEDCNIIVKTKKEKYVVKIFSKERTKGDVLRYSKIMEEAFKSGANHPELLKTIKGDLVFSDSQANNISMVLMRFINGKTFLETNSTPDIEDLKSIINQVVKISEIKYKPPYVFDSWAIPNIREVFNEIKSDLSGDDRYLLERVIDLYLDIPIKKLPHCFVHGDITKANVLKGDDGILYILDFSVSNWYPRIQELAVISANLLYSENDSKSLKDRVDLVISEYEKISSLSADEKMYLYNYSLAGVAMEFMGAFREKFIKKNTSEETDYWLNLGRNSLEKEINNKGL